LFARDRLLAWCIVPFDTARRGPEQRAVMLERLGFKHFAYDYRAEHVPTFDAEIAALKKHGIALDAWWFPAELNDEAKQILDVCRRNDVRPQLWVTGGGEPTSTPDDHARRVAQEVARLRPIAEAAAAIGCRVGLYNHGGWFGEPENQLAILDALNLPNVGLVYNLHHAHEQIDRFAELLAKMQPHLLALNLNGMDRDGQRHGRQVLPLGQGELDLELLKAICASGYRGPIGILGHTQDDAELRLRDNLDGLDWLVSQLAGQPAGPRPKPRTAVPGGDKPADLQREKLPAEYDAKTVDELVAAARGQGNARRGLEVFRSARFACLGCHQVGRTGGAVGPCLSDVGRRLKAEEMAEAILWPKRQVKPEYSAWQLVLSDGRTLQGYKRGELADGWRLFDPATQQTVNVDPAQIEARREIGTLMPDGLAAGMSAAERGDLLRFLLELGVTAGLDDAVQPLGPPADFAYERAPLDRHGWPSWEHPVNRQRLYDFYLKQALYFRDQQPRPHVLREFPGLDGGKLGHWGNQNEQAWKDARWNEVDLGTVLAGVFHGPDGDVPKGICVRLGEHGELSACFNPQTLRYEALWRDGFLKFSDTRHGFMDGLHPAGQMLPRPAGQPVAGPFKYHGYFRCGPRVVFSYRIGEVELLDAPWVTGGEFTRVVAPAGEHPLKDEIRKAEPQWPQEFAATGQLGAGRPYAVDVIPTPAQNPWHALFFFGDHDFLADGSALISTMQGDVWRVTGLDDSLRDIRWRRFASGLHQPLGLVVSGGEVFVQGRDQVTRLEDRNHDGEADYYECFSSGLVTSPGGHDFVCGLARDEQGRFYTASSKQGLIRTSADGQHVDVLATGFRNPDGLGLCRDGAVTVPCSEGDWTPASMIALVEPRALNLDAPSATGSITRPHFGAGGPQRGQPPELPLVYLPRGLDNSAGGQTTVPDGRWGPLEGQLLHFSFGMGSHFLLLRDKVDDRQQGAVVPLAGEFRSGAHRGRFNPRDGQLYVSGMAGWGSYTPDDGSFQRVRFTGDRVQLPRSFHVHENGVQVSFTEPVDPANLTDLGRHFAQAWNYRYGPGYGSPEFAVGHPGVVGHQVLDIAGLHPIDERTLFVELPELQPVNQLHLVLQLGAGRPQELFITAHKLDRPFTQFAGYRARDKVIAAHPLLFDMAQLGKTLPNPWRGGQKYTAELEIAAGSNLTFSKRELHAKAGEVVKLTMRNPDAVPHNWVLLKPGTLAATGDLANRLVADPQAVMRQYVPQTDNVLVYTDVVGPDDEFKVYFRVPAEKGRYPYLCTFPGHWMVMNGELIVD
jgi:putative heme-binding domain-containing protein